MKLFVRNILSCALFIFSGAFFVIPSSVQAHEDHSALRHWEIASPDPDRIFLSFYEDPATSRAVTWRTSTEITEAVAEISESLGEPAMSLNSKRIQATTTMLDLGSYHKNRQGEVNYHSAVFTELKPETLYAYRVGDGDSRWSEWIQFRTAAATPKPFTFLYFGDAQNGILEYWSRVIRKAYQQAPNADFTIHAGDLTNFSHFDMEWAEWFKAGGFIHAQVTGIPVLGNHEYWRLGKDAPKYDKEVSILWRPQFTLPVEPSLSENLHETVYTVDYQGAQIIVLNSNYAIQEQTAYLKEQLERPGFQWRIVTFHHSIYPPMGGRRIKGSQEIRDVWAPLLEEYDVDLVLMGHDHSYARAQKMPDQKEGSLNTGSTTVYVTSVSGPKQADHDPEAAQQFEDELNVRTLRMAENTQFFQVIDVAEDSLNYRAYTATGELYDSLVIKKDQASGQKTIIEPETMPEIRSFENTIFNDEFRRR